MAPTRTKRRRRDRDTAPGHGARPLVLLLLAVLMHVVVLLAHPSAVSEAPLVVLVVLAAFTLSRRRYLAFSAVAVAAALGSTVAVGTSHPAPAVSLLCVVLTVPLMAYLLRGRHRLGMAGDRAEHLLLEMRRRLRRSTDLPALPDPWRAEAHIAPAFGETFGGDVVVSSVTPTRFEVAIVDVAGNGLVAAARSTQLTGALGALIGSVPAREFVPRANDYVLRQGWDDGFATLVHVAVDLETGGYSLGRAGHPAPLVREPDGRWSFLEGASSTPLGVVAGAAYPRRSGLLPPGAGMVLYSDGLVESRDTPSLEGGPRLLRLAGSLVTSSFAGAAARLASDAPSSAEDRTVVCVWRRDSRG